MATDEEDLFVVVFDAQRDQLPFEIRLEECGIHAGCLRVLHGAKGRFWQL